MRADFVLKDGKLAADGPAEPKPKKQRKRKAAGDGSEALKAARPAEAAGAAKGKGTKRKVKLWHHSENSLLVCPSCQPGCL